MIESYGVEVTDWQEGDCPALNKDAEFFKTQCQKGEENPVFEVTTWEEESDNTVKMYFSPDETPDQIDVSDMVLNDDGSIRYEGVDSEVIYRSGYVNEATGVVEFNVSQHYSIDEFEPDYSGDLTQPFYRGYAIRCYWGTDDGLQSCTYYMVLRTRSTAYDVVK